MNDEDEKSMINFELELIIYWFPFVYVRNYIHDNLFDNDIDNHWLNQYIHLGRDMVLLNIHWYWFHRRDQWNQVDKNIEWYDSFSNIDHYLNINFDWISFDRNQEILHKIFLDNSTNIDIHKSHFDWNICPNFDMVVIDKVFDRFHNVYQYNLSNNDIDISFDLSHMFHYSNKDYFHMDQSIFDKIFLCNYFDIDKQNYSIGKDKYRCYNKVDWNNDRFEWDNLYRLDQLDSNNDNLWKLTNGNYHHFDKDKRISKGMIDREFPWNYLHKEGYLNEDFHRIIQRKKITRSYWKDNGNDWIFVHKCMRNNDLTLDLSPFDMYWLSIDLIAGVFLYHWQYIIEDHYISQLNSLVVNVHIPLVDIHNENLDSIEDSWPLIASFFPTEISRGTRTMKTTDIVITCSIVCTGFN